MNYINDLISRESSPDLAKTWDLKINKVDELQVSIKKANAV